ncbi:MAG TPA: hypothetical protein VMB18_14505 [Terriglobales bacterium]|nr:hypothetical protein [Terriglobales bacterium]
MTSARKRNDVSSVRENLPPVTSPEPPQIVPNRPPGNTSSVHSSASESWRELAQRIQQETDPAVMIELTHQLIAELDAEKSRKPRTK